jgi:hypothetical protein
MANLLSIGGIATGHYNGPIGDRDGLLAASINDAIAGPQPNQRDWFWCLIVQFGRRISNPEWALLSKLFNPSNFYDSPRQMLAYPPPQPHTQADIVNNLIGD